MFDSSKQIRIGAIISYVTIIVNVALGLFYTPWMVNSIGKAEYGLYTLAMSVISLFVFDFGLGNAVTRYVAKFLAEGNLDKINKLLGIIYKLYIWIDVFVILVLLCVYFFIPHIYKGLTPQELEQFKLVYVVVSIFSVVSFPFIPLNGILSAYEKFIQLKLCDLFHRLLVVTLMSICLFAGFGLYALVLVNAIAGIIIIIIKLLIIRSVTTLKIDWTLRDRALLKSILSFSLWVTIIALSQRCIFNVAPSVLGVWADAQSIAILGIAITVEGYVYTISTALSGLFLPKVTRLTCNSTNDNVLPLMIKVGRILIFLIGFVIIEFICVGEDFIAVWMGQGYNDVYICSVLLMIPSFFYHPLDIGSTTLTATNNLKYKSYLYVAIAIINIILSIPLAAHYGAVGICISVLVSYSIRTIGLYIIFYNVLKIDIWKFIIETYGKLFLPLLISYVISDVLVNTITFGLSIGWVRLIVHAVLIGLLYGLIIYFTGMNSDEKNLIKSIQSKI